MSHRSRTWLAAIAWCVAAAAGVHADPTNPEPLSAFPQSLLAIRTTSGKVFNFKIWTADTPGREQQGLMFIRELDSHAGMLFMFPGDQRPSMWMKNTYISLDMVFIGAHGRVEDIVANATPLSLDIIRPRVAARAVLELKGGTASELGLQIGDLVVHQRFSNLK